MPVAGPLFFLEEELSHQQRRCQAHSQRMENMLSPYVLTALHLPCSAPVLYHGLDQTQQPALPGMGTWTNQWPLLLIAAAGRWAGLPLFQESVPAQASFLQHLWPQHHGQPWIGFSQLDHGHVLMFRLKKR